MNKSVKKCCICDNEQIGEFITIENKKYHLCCIEQLQENYKAVLKQRDDTNKSAIRTIEEYQIAVDKTMSEKMDLEHNWNELKKFIKKECSYDYAENHKIYRKIFYKMHELEEGGNNE